MMKADEENYTKEITSLKEELKKLQEQTRSHTPPRRLDLQKQDSVDSKSESHMSLSFKSVLERQEGEVMFCFDENQTLVRTNCQNKFFF